MRVDRATLWCSLVAMATFGCGGPMSSAVSGPVAISIGDIDHMCRAVDGQRGCMMKHPNGTLTIYCRDESRDALAECLAHEIHHITNPEWRHE